MGRGGRQSALRDQRAELRPLQNLRHQGPEPEHQLGAARRRRRAELSEYVMARHDPAHDQTLSMLPRFRRPWGQRPVALRPPRSGFFRVLAGALQKGHSRPHWHPALDSAVRRSSFANGAVVIHSLLPWRAAIVGAAVFAEPAVGIAAAVRRRSHPARQRRPAIISPPAMPASSATPPRPRPTTSMCSNPIRAIRICSSRAFLSVLTEGDMDEAGKLADRCCRSTGPTASRAWCWACARSSRSNTRSRGRTSPNRCAARSPISPRRCWRHGRLYRRRRHARRHGHHGQALGPGLVSASSRICMPA